MHCRSWALAVVVLAAATLRADPPVASYVFPAGGQRGRAVEVRVGGLYLHQTCGFALDGPGVQVTPRLQSTRTAWFEGPFVPLPDSQQAEDYPKDMAGTVTLAADAPTGVRAWRVWTSQGVTPAGRFVVGDLPEVVEEEIDGDPVPVAVQTPVTVNGRIFPREDVDVWTVRAEAGQTFTCEVQAARLGSPLEARLEVRGPDGRRVAECDDGPGGDPRLRFTAGAKGEYQVRIQDVAARGGQAFVYRLTVTGGPYVDRTFPLGGRRGRPLPLELSGQGVPARASINVPADAPAAYPYRLTVNGQSTNEVLLDLDDVEEHVEADASGPPPAVAVPAVCNGRIGRPGEVDAWPVRLRKGENVEVELRAARLGSPLLGVLTVLDPSGRELARADATAGGMADPSLRVTAPADGTFTVRVQERFRGRGGPEFAYRLRLAPPPAPDFRLRLASDTVAVPRGGEVKLKVAADRVGGHNGPISLSVEGLPAGVTAAPAAIPAGQSSADVVLKATPTAAVTAVPVKVRGTSGVTAPREAVLSANRGIPTSDRVYLAVTVPTPFKVVGAYDLRLAPRGTVHHRRYRIERNGFDGPIEVRLADRQARHLQGATGPTVTVPPGATEFAYPVSLAPWMETGRTCRVCVMAVGHVQDPDGRRHPVSYTSAAQNDQVIAVIEPGPLGIETERTSIAAVPGEETELPIRISRAPGRDGPVRVELAVPEHMPFVTAAPIEVPSGQDRATLRLRIARVAAGPWNMPVTVRATLPGPGDPVRAEAKVDLRPPGR